MSTNTYWFLGAALAGFFLAGTVAQIPPFGWAYAQGAAIAR